MEYWYLQLLCFHPCVILGLWKNISFVDPIFSAYVYLLFYYYLTNKLCPPLSLIAFFKLNSICSEINKTVPTFFFTIDLLDCFSSFHSMTVIFRCVSCKKQIDVFYLFIHISILFLLIGEFSPLTFGEFIDVKGCIAILLCGAVSSTIDNLVYKSGLSVFHSGLVFLLQILSDLVCLRMVFYPSFPSKWEFYMVGNTSFTDYFSVSDLNIQVPSFLAWTISYEKSVEILILFLLCLMFFFCPNAFQSIFSLLPFDYYASYLCSIWVFVL